MAIYYSESVLRNVSQIDNINFKFQNIKIYCPKVQDKIRFILNQISCSQFSDNLSFYQNKFGQFTHFNLKGYKRIHVNQKILDFVLKDFKSKKTNKKILNCYEGDLKHILDYKTG